MASVNNIMVNKHSERRQYQTICLIPGKDVKKRLNVINWIILLFHLVFLGGGVGEG